MSTDLDGREPEVDAATAVRPEAATVRVGVLARGARAARARLLDALEQAYPVRFEEVAGRDGELDWRGCDGLLAIGSELPAEIPTDLPCLHAVAEERSRQDAISPIELGAHPSLARALRGATLTDRWTRPLPQTLTRTHTTLATCGGAPTWILQAGPPAAAPSEPAGPTRRPAHREVVAAAPAELEPGESLRERLAPERCLALLALVHFVRRLAGDRTLQAPLDAAFVLDDPNLHWPSYGHVRYAELARHARAHGYHMAIAMPPIDGWFAHPRAARVFREHPAELSLCVHGNDHRGAELGRVRSPSEGRALALQALARAATFQRRTGIPYEPVMVPPHEGLSEPAARGLLAAGIDAVCVSRPYPWIAPARAGAAAALSAGPPERGALAGWAPREPIAGGLPVLLRAGFDAPREDLALRAFLGQPLILYGHHDQLAGGLDVLADARAAIDALGDVRWGSLGAIAAATPPRSARTTTPTTSPARTRLRPLLRRLSSEARDRIRR